MHILESQWETNLTGFCKNLGILFLKLKLASEGSWPDRTLLYKGRVMFLELKRAGEKPTPIQQYRINDLHDQGFYAVWADDILAVKEAILEWKSYVDNSRPFMAQIRSVHRTDPGPRSDV